MADLEDFIEIDVSEKTRELAKEYARKLGSLPGSIKNGEGNVGSFIGKIVVSDYLEVELHTESKHYTVMYGGRRAAVKVTETGVCPDSSYSAKVQIANSENQGCEIYIFVRVTYDYKKAWILGWYPKEHFLKNAEKTPAGTRDARNGWKASADCYIMDISQLAPLEKYLIDIQ